MKHLTKRPDGRYRTKYKDKYFYGATEREALAARDEYKYKCERDIDQISPITVAEYASEWLPVAKASVSVKCYNSYAKQLDKLCAVCGGKLMQAVTPSDIKKVWQGFVGMSDSIIHKALIIYKALFEAAIEDGHCRKNPVKAESAKPHKGTKGSHRAITDEERYLIEHTPHKVQTAAMIMLYAGLRRGEVMALSDKDIYDGYIHVNKAVSYNSNKGVISTPKTVNAYREVPVLNILKPYLEGLNGLVLTKSKSRGEGIMSEMAITRAWDSYMKKLSETAGHPVYFRPHDLRHSYCTMLRDKGVDMKLAIKWLGHADEQMILRIYDHVTDKRIQSAIDLLNNGGQTGVKENSDKIESVAT